MHYSTFSCRARRFWHAGLPLVLSLCFFNLAWAQNNAATVMALSGQAKAIDPQGRERALEKGAELFAGDRIVTSASTLVQVRLHDGGYMSVRANTEMVIDRFVLDEKDASKSSFLVSLLRGGFRSITGLIGRSNPSGYQIRTATATIGIRGTDHEPVLVLDTPEAQAQTQSPPGLYDKVNDGETFISNKGGVLSLKRGDVGFAPLSPDIPPQVLLKIPEFYKIDLKTDARDAKDGDEKSDGNKRGAGVLLRPSVAGRREALSGAGTAGQPGTDATSNTGINSTTMPVLTPEQKRAILQTITTTPLKSETTTQGTTLTAPKITAPITTTPLQR